MAIVLTIFILLFSLSLFGQGAAETPKAEAPSRPVKVSLLGGYYDQDGDHSAVNGGRGSQELFSNTLETSIYIPVKDSSGIRVDGGFDYFTSASMRLIDKYKSSASTGTSGVSGDELRTFAHLGFDLAPKKNRNIMFSPSLGFSKEYDVSSFNTGIAFSRNLKKRHGNFTSGISYIADRWMLVYPGEFRASTSAYTTSASGEYTTGASEYTTGASETSGSTGSGGTSGGNLTTHGENYRYNSNYRRGSGSESGSGSTSGQTSGGTTSGTASGSTSGSTSSGSGEYTYETPAVSSAATIPVTGRTIEKDGKTYPVDMRQSLSFTNGYTFVINKKMNAGGGLDLIAQWGMLSTPFHRVYFNDGVQDDFYKEVHIEKLPGIRVKAAAYGRFNYSVNSYLKLRAHIRYYYDNWNIQALSTTIEAPLKVTNYLTFTPFYRVHFQTASKYFAGYSEHTYRADAFYTSDYDLSKFTANKIGGAVRFAPLRPIAGMKSRKSERYLFAFKTAGLRYSAYKRTDGLTSRAVTFELTFEL